MQVRLGTVLIVFVYKLLDLSAPTVSKYDFPVLYINT